MKLSGKTVLFLGSSVTYGAESGGVSFVEIMSEKCGCTYIKEAVSGTTLADIDKLSYVSRLKNIDVNQKVDLFICQLSTNDSYKNIPFKETEKAIVSIVNYVRKNFCCPIVFYTGTRFNSEEYKKAVFELLRLKEKYGFYVLDLWNDVDMNAVSAEDYNRFMKDGVHPTLSGYREWWTPKFIDFCNKI